MAGCSRGNVCGPSRSPLTAASGATFNGGEPFARWRRSRGMNRKRAVAGVTILVGLSAQPVAAAPACDSTVSHTAIPSSARAGFQGPGASRVAHVLSRRGDIVAIFVRRDPPCAASRGPQQQDPVGVALPHQHTARLADLGTGNEGKHAGWASGSTGHTWSTRTVNDRPARPGLLAFQPAVGQPPRHDGPALPQPIAPIHTSPDP